MNNKQTMENTTFDGFVKQAYDKIESIHKEPKGKGFIRHLAASFLPIDTWGLTLHDNTRCCITKKRGFSVTRMAEFNVERLLLSAKMMGDNPKEVEDAEKEFEELRLSIVDYFKIEDGEDISQTRKMYIAHHDSKKNKPKSDKLLSLPALIALRDFVLSQLLKGDRSMCVTIKTSQFSDIPNVSKKQANVVAMKSAGYNLSEGNENVFSQLRETFKDK